MAGLARGVDLEVSNALLSEAMYEDIREVLLALNPEQVRFVFERVVCKTDIDAAKRAGVNTRTVNMWRSTVPELSLAVRLLLLKPLESALARLESAALQAANVLVGLLDSDSEKVQLQTANSIFKHLGVGSTKYLEIRGRVKLQPDIPDDELLARAQAVMERSGHSLPDPNVVEGEIVS